MNRLLGWVLCVAVLLMAGWHAPQVAAQPKIPKVLFCAGFGDPNHVFSRVFVDSLARAPR